MNLEKRQAWVLQARSENKTYEYIARSLSVTPARAKTLLKKAEQVRALPAWLNGLKLATARVVVTRGFRNKDEVRTALDTGSHIDRIGTSRRAELRRWLDGETVASYKP